MKLKKIVVIGTGLIGGSISKCVLDKKIAAEVAGVCRRQSSLDRAKKEKSITTGYLNNYQEAVKGADIVFIATPVQTVGQVLEGLSDAITNPKTIVTDVGSTKKEIVQAAEKYKDKFIFVGSHPLAGSEKKGVEFSRADLFKNSLCVLTKSSGTDENAINVLKSFWETLGAKVNVITPAKHDEILAVTSHLPHFVAFVLAGILDKEYADYVATGFKDTTRIASSDSVLWSDIFLSNKDNLMQALNKFKKLSAKIEEALQNENEDDLKKILTECKEKRDEVI